MAITQPAVGTGTSNATASSGNSWESWTGGTFTTGVSSTWVYWTSSLDTSIYVQSRQYTEDELDAIRQRNEEHQQRQKERKQKKKEAEKRADQLLRSLLSEEQIAQLDELSAFIVTTPKGNTYRIKHGWVGNVEKLNKQGKPTDRFCIHPKLYVPHADNMATQKLLLENNESEFLRIANRTRLAV